MKFSVSALALLLAASTVLADPKIEVYFSPKGGCTEAVVDALSKAKTTVLVQAYSFTSPPIAKALTEAHRRGVKGRRNGTRLLRLRASTSNNSPTMRSAGFTKPMRCDA